MAAVLLGELSSTPGLSQPSLGTVGWGPACGMWCPQALIASSCWVWRGSLLGPEHQGEKKNQSPSVAARNLLWWVVSWAVLLFPADGVLGGIGGINGTTLGCHRHCLWLSFSVFFQQPGSPQPPPHPFSPPHGMDMTGIPHALGSQVRQCQDGGRWLRAGVKTRG